MNWIAWVFYLWLRKGGIDIIILWMGGRGRRDRGDGGDGVRFLFYFGIGFCVFVEEGKGSG